MTTPLFLLRCKQLGLSMTELDMLTIGLINDMFTEQENDDYNYPMKADQAGMDAFKIRQYEIAAMQEAVQQRSHRRQRRVLIV